SRRGAGGRGPREAGIGEIERASPRAPIAASRAAPENPAMRARSPIRSAPGAAAWARIVAWLVLATAAFGCGRTRTPQPAAGAERGPEFGDAFWKTWGDGRGELCGYDLETPRYGAPRRGVAVTIFVTETFSSSRPVKSDP